MTGALPAVHVKVTVTSVLFQPLALGAGEMEALIDGGVPPVVTVKLAPLLGMPPTVSTTLPEVAPLGTGTVMLVSLQLVGWRLCR